MNVLAISGSLRAASINAALLRAMQRLAPDHIRITLAQGLGELPLFNPDLEAHVPAGVNAFRADVVVADALLIASPEYAHGVSGTIKNALDWLVSFEPFVGKPVAVLNAASRAHHADESLREILKTMSAFIVEPASIVVPLTGATLRDDDMVASPVVAHALRESLGALHAVM